MQGLGQNPRPTIEWSCQEGTTGVVVRDLTLRLQTRLGHAFWPVPPACPRAFNGFSMPTPAKGHSPERLRLRACPVPGRCAPEFPQARFVERARTSRATRDRLNGSPACLRPDTHPCPEARTARCFPADAGNLMQVSESASPPAHEGCWGAQVNRPAWAPDRSVVRGWYSPRRSPPRCIPSHPGHRRFGGSATKSRPTSRR